MDLEEPKDNDSSFRLITSEGSVLCDGLSALRYFARMRPDVCLYGRSFDEMAVVDSWLQYIESNVTIPLVIWKESGCYDEKIKSDVMSSLTKKIEAHLLTHTFLAGERLTIADINLALGLNQALSVDKDLIKGFSSTQRWLNTIVAQNVIKKHLGGSGGIKKETNAAPVQPKTPKKESASKEQSAADIEDEIAAEEKARAKKANPLDSLPPSPFILDAWKREYSNTKDLMGVAMPWFWEHFDNEGWSLWYMRYDKMEGENTVGFTTANMLGGFLQRLDANFRKYSFAVINVVGENGDFDIQGIWLLRGHKIPFELKDHPSFEYNTFRKLDAKSDKALIEEYWCNDE